MPSLLTRYTGTKAEKYDAKRKDTERFRNEDAAFTAFMQRLGPQGTVLDLPVGTGRWLPWMKDCAGPVFGVDLSADMLEVAKQKAGDDARVRLLQADVFDPALASHVPVCDLVICVRFLNWLPTSDAGRAFGVLAGRAGKSMIVGVSLVPRDGTAAPEPRPAWLFGRFRKQKKKENAVPSYVHDEATVLGWFTEAGLGVREKTFVHRMPDRENFFFLLSRATPLRGSA